MWTTVWRCPYCLLWLSTKANNKNNTRQTRVLCSFNEHFPWRQIVFANCIDSLVLMMDWVSGLGQLRNCHDVIRAIQYCSIKVTNREKNFEIRQVRVKMSLAGIVLVKSWAWVGAAAFVPCRPIAAVPKQSLQLSMMWSELTIPVFYNWSWINDCNSYRHVVIP